RFQGVLLARPGVDVLDPDGEHGDARGADGLLLHRYAVVGEPLAIDQRRRDAAQDVVALVLEADGLLVPRTQEAREEGLDDGSEHPEAGADADELPLARDRQPVLVLEVLLDVPPLATDVRGIAAARRLALAELCPVHRRDL